ncbi:GNAT family N-acetyltransferase [Flagellimonas sp.]|uniref:GNAT family N-acetyltransferase n=1 Tax=Flagellimonas sp. TaxID=2058762 RepID=UPI003AB71FDF
MEQINIREAKKSDSAEIVELLKIALGEGTEKSVANWHWKHYDNPFGKSKIYVATIGPEIVGVRAFMQWKWLEKSTGKELRALRAVDTAVSPDHQRKGIFLTLTNHALEMVREENFDFIFNTPNAKSIGGYLKLGWVLNRRIPVNLLVNPLFWFSSKKKIEKLAEGTVPFLETKNSKFHSPFSKSDIECAFSIDYFKWRYVDNPLATYKYFQCNDSVLVVYRLKVTKKITECRVVDIQLLDPNAHSQIKKALTLLSKRYLVVSMADGIVKATLLSSPFFVALRLQKKGPNMVTKNVNLPESKYQDLLNTRSPYWGFNLGDMELF